MFNLIERYKIRIKALIIRKSFKLLMMLLFCWINVFTQNVLTEPVEKMQDVRRPAYINIGVGWSFSSFRDFATSPLVYSGNPLQTSLAHVDIDNRRESQIMLSYSTDNYKVNFNEHTSESKVNTFSLNYLELFQVHKVGSSKVNFKVGGQFNITANHRENTQLFNNSEGVDIISTLFASAKATLDLSRSVNKSKKFLFINYNVKKRVRTLSYTVNIGIINSSYRNGFSYTSPSAPLNEDDFFAGYEFKIFEGFRINNSLDYTIYLQNKNAIQFSYIWDTYRTGGHHNNFEMAAHILKFSLLFGLK